LSYSARGLAAMQRLDKRRITVGKEQLTNYASTLVEFSLSPRCILHFFA